MELLPEYQRDLSAMNLLHITGRRDLIDGRIVRITSVLNPDKLARLDIRSDALTVTTQASRTSS